MRKENIGKFMSVKDLTTYEVLKDEDLKGIKAKGKLLKHKKSGARVLLVENDDNNKVFSIAFRTPPSDSTGVPHIMEHSVLCGSKNFPAKDPFVELVKGSLNTFLNAMTYPDKTVYPVACGLPLASSDCGNLRLISRKIPETLLSPPQWKAPFAGDRIGLR